MDESSRDSPIVTVIIPTTGSIIRHKSLMRAIDSVLMQCDISVKLLIILNGSVYDADVRKSLEENNCLNVKFVEKGSLPLAIAHGRAVVETKYFCFLDDDDELLPDSLSSRVSVMEANPLLDAVVTNGVKHLAGEEKQFYDSLSDCGEDPMMSLFSRGNFLASCGGLFREASITLDFFDPEQKYFEWTLVAFKLAHYRMNVEYLDINTFVINDSAGSLSKDGDNHKYEYLFYNRLNSYDLPRKIQSILLEKKMNSLHKASGYYLLQGDMRLAWKKHFSSLATVKSFRNYILFTRKLLGANLIRNPRSKPR